MTSKIPINPLTLRFPEELEQIFFEEYFKKSLSQVRFALLLALFFMAISGFLDQWLSPDIRDKALLFRYGFLFPVTTGFLFFTFSRLFKRLMQPVISLFIILIILIFIGFSVFVRDVDLENPEIIIMILYAYTAIKLNFVYATFVGWLTILFAGIVNAVHIKPSLINLLESSLELVFANILGMFSSYLMEYYIRKDFFQDRLLAEEREKVERLLLNILPQPIAERLKQEPITIADSFTEATIMFADIVGFTPLSARLSATEIVNLLNHIFSTFDRLAERHGLEKIKTIGDAYMVVGGLPTPRPDHAESVAEMALDMQQEIAKFSRELDESFSIRIGINTGPVVAGVIGLKKFIYDLWGDAVNTASRMESHGMPNCIQVSQTTYELLQDKYLFEERGVIEVKGKGEMFTYLLRGRKVIE
jgi:class 3 adenylate cyclase